MMNVSIVLAAAATTVATASPTAAPTAIATGTAPSGGSSSPADFTGFFIAPETGQWIGLLIYGIATAVAVGIAVTKHAEFKGVLSDKAALPETGTDMTSFSRLTGLIGVVYLTAFLWGLGFFVLTYIWVDPEKIGKVVSDCGQFLMAGSALFAPYAFNQLSQVFGSKGAGAGADRGGPTMGKLTSDDIARGLTPKG